MNRDFYDLIDLIGAHAPEVGEEDHGVVYVAHEQVTPDEARELARALSLMADEAER